MKYQKKYFPTDVLMIYILTSILIIFSVAPCYSDYVHITNITSKNDGKNLLVSYKVVGAFNESLNEKIESGLSTEFNFWLRLIMQRPPFGEKKLAEKRIVHKVTYDNITGKYTVHVMVNSWKAEYTFTSFAQMQQKMSDIRDIPIIEVEKLDANKEYYLMIKGELVEKVDYLGFPMNFFLSFFSNEFSTGWKISDSFLIDKIEKMKKPLRK